MRSFTLLSLAGSALAVPFADVFSNLFARYPYHPDYSFPTGTGLPLPTDFPFPTGTGLPFPTGTFPGGPLPTESAGLYSRPAPVPNRPVASRVLKINYSLAPQKVQNFGKDLVPAFPAAETGAAYPTGTGPAFPFPPGGYPTGAPPGFPPDGFPTGAPPSGFPTGVFPGFPTTLATLTRGPTPTGEPDYPESPEDEQNSGRWKRWI